ncbi:MAG: hypothetical protein MJY53_02325 [Bacteroidales bacterium]|nr:hypothetical protein [Bacteroidales bacterium]
MKKLFFALAACLCAIGCSPLRIVMNSKNEDGERIVLTSDKRLFNDVSVALGAKVAGKDTVLAVLVTYDGNSTHGVFDKDDRMLVRLSDQKVITLNNVYHKEFEEETVTNTTTRRVSDFGYAYSYDPYTDDIYVTPYEVSRFIPQVSTTHITRSYALYFISRPDLDAIIDKGVIKLRIELENSELDMPNTGSVSKTFGKLKDCLYDGIRSGIVRTEF